MSFILFNHEHSNTRGFYTATYNTMNQHIFFCNETDCSNKVPMYLGKCVDCAEPPVTHCEDCGAWSQVFPDNCCHTCHMARVRRAPADGWCPEGGVCVYCFCGSTCAEEYLSEHRCDGEFEPEFDAHCCEDCLDCYGASPPPGCVDCGEDYSVGLALDPTRCPRCVLSAQHPCTGRRNSVTSPVAELFTRPCGVEGCTTRALYYSMPPDVDEGHLILRCEEHYEPLPVSPISDCYECDKSEDGDYADYCACPTPARSLEDSRAAIAHIKEKLTTRMTFGQTEHWERLLEFREKELAENEAEMWAGYDADDLRKLDLQNRRGF